MIEGGGRGAGSFGRRRAEDRPQAWPFEAAGGTDDPPPPARGTLSWALRTAALVGLGSVLAAQILVRHTAPGPDAVVQVARRAVPADPETTGAIGGGMGDPVAAGPGCGPLIACLHAPLRVPPARPRP